MIFITAFVRTTIMIIAVCALGISGNVSSLNVRDGSMFAVADIRRPFAWGGFIVGNAATDEAVLVHESGHLIQEQKYRYLHEFVVVLPSMLSIVLSDSAKEHGSRWFELEATELGNR